MRQSLIRRFRKPRSETFQQPILTDRLRIRPLARADVATFSVLGADDEVFRWIPEISGPFDARAWIDELFANPENYFRHAVEVVETGEAVGAVQLNRRPNLTLQLGYWFGKRYWGQGYATETVEGVLALVDGVTREPIHAAVHPENIASRRVLENNGFVFMGKYINQMMEFRRVRAPF